MIYNEWKIGTDFTIREIDNKGKRHAFVIFSNDGKNSSFVVPKTIKETNKIRQLIQELLIIRGWSDVS
jgi:hypothetical protein